MISSSDSDSDLESPDPIYTISFPIMESVPSKKSVLRKMLLFGASVGDLDMVLLALDRGADVNCNSEEALCVAVVNGHLDMVRLLLNKGADFADVYLNNKNSIGDELDDVDLLRVAIDCGHVEIARLLVEKGMDVNDPDSHPLIHAAYHSNVDMVRMLLEHGADIHVARRDDDAVEGPLSAAVETGNTEVVRLLLDKGAYINAPGLLLRDAIRTGKKELVLLLLERGVDLVHQHDVLYTAARKGDVEIVKLLLDYGADFSSNNHEALRESVINDNREVARLLLERGSWCPGWFSYPLFIEQLVTRCGVWHEDLGQHDIMRNWRANYQFYAKNISATSPFPSSIIDIILNYTTIDKPENKKKRKNSNSDHTQSTQPQRSRARMS